MKNGSPFFLFFPARPLNLAAMSDLLFGVWSQNRKCLQVEETAVEEMDDWKATPLDSAILKIFNGAPIPDGWPTDPITTEIITSQCGLTMTCLFSVISLQQFLRWKFRYMFTE